MADIFNAFRSLEVPAPTPTPSPTPPPATIIDDANKVKESVEGGFKNPLKEAWKRFLKGLGLASAAAILTIPAAGTYLASKPEPKQPAAIERAADDRVAPMQLADGPSTSGAREIASTEVKGLSMAFANAGDQE